MSMQKRQRYMFALLVASVLFGLYMRPWERRVRVVSTAPSASEQAEAVVVAPVTQSASVEFVTDWPARDPFTRPQELVRESRSVAIEDDPLGAPELVVQGIMTVNGQVVCVIGGRTCSVGSLISGWRIDKIEAQGVWVSQGGERHFVPLP